MENTLIFTSIQYDTEKAKELGILREPEYDPTAQTLIEEFLNTDQLEVSREELVNSIKDEVLAKLRIEVNSIFNRYLHEIKALDRINGSKEKYI